LTMSETTGTVAHMDFSHVLTLIIGLLFGAIVAWALTRSRLTAALATARTQAQSERARAEEIAADYTARLADQQQLHRQRLEELKGDHQRLADAFDSLSAKALERNSRAFLADRKSTRLNSSHVSISYAVFCLKKKTQPTHTAG